MVQFLILKKALKKREGYFKVFQYLDHVRKWYLSNSGIVLYRIFSHRDHFTKKKTLIEAPREGVAESRR